MNDNVNMAVSCLKNEAQAIIKVAEQLASNYRSEFDKAINILMNTKGRVILTGVGKSGHIAAKIAATLSSTGTPAYYVNPLDAYHGDLGLFTKDDSVIAISHSGRTEELIRFIPTLISRNIPIIAMVGNTDSTLSDYADVSINVHVDREACPLNLAPTSSTTVALAMGDAIAVTLMQLKNVSADDFAVNHPGGELGKKLLAASMNNRRNN